MTPTLPNRIFRAEVVQTEKLTPAMARVTFGGPELGEFLSTGTGDEYLRLFLPNEGEAEPSFPIPKGDYWGYPDGVKESPVRTYTVRSTDPERGQVCIDFVLHQGGVAASWARRAKPGDVVAVNSPVALYDPPSDMTWQLILADAAGLPAAARLLEQTPPGVKTRAVLEVSSAAEKQSIKHHDEVEIIWVYGGNGRRPSCLEDILRSSERPSGAGYIWVAGEAKTMRGARRYLRHELKLPCTDYKIVGYWTAHGEEWMAKYEALPAETLAELTAMWESGRDEEEIEDEYTAKLESLGL